MQEEQIESVNDSILSQKPDKFQDHMFFHYSTGLYINLCNVSWTIAPNWGYWFDIQSKINLLEVSEHLDVWPP